MVSIIPDFLLDALVHICGQLLRMKIVIIREGEHKQVIFWQYKFSAVNHCMRSYFPEAAVHNAHNEKSGRSCFETLV